MTDLFIIIGLLIMGIIDIKRKAVPLWILMLFSVISVVLCIANIIKGKYQINIRCAGYFLIYVVITLIISVYGKMIGIADMIIIAGIAVSSGIKRALSISMISLLLVSIFAGILLICKRVNAKKKIAFLPFLFVSYLGVVLCG